MPDIQALLTDLGEVKLSSVSAFSEQLSKRIGNRVEEERSKQTLRLSNLGTPCKRKLWYSINLPGVGEPLTADTHLKFLYGDLLEETVLWLAKEAGHLVVGEQDEVDLFGVKGHIDCIIDGVLVDVKSASSASFTRFSNHLHADDDSFGYLVQLDAYLHAAPSTRLPVLDLHRGAFLVIDKTLGKLTLDIHPKSMINYKEVVDETRKILASSEPPPRRYTDEPFGKSGNHKLGTVCSYCSFKRPCWVGVRTFLYSTGPVYLTRVHRPPAAHIHEIKS